MCRLALVCVPSGWLRRSRRLLAFAPVAVIVFAAVAGCGTRVPADSGTQFGTAGKVRTDFGGDDVAEALAIQGDGKIVAAGRKGHAFALARYAPDGELDESFGTAGRVVTNFGAPRASKCGEPCAHGAAALAIQGDGKIVAPGARAAISRSPATCRTGDSIPPSAVVARS